ncbi:hypothetical protein BDQ12DRAFT_668735 [Crucibulum laeve]|uniref:Uncharacterized protein n=1 Tax=Crucibulum laeve TaxID=68775 RepID=A0A5C3LR74_9AGAR|nr:hypothetical protein BDQ12DRAFT_668735 [Crucibulum laeve]
MLEPPIRAMVKVSVVAKETSCAGSGDVLRRSFHRKRYLLLIDTVPPSRYLTNHRNLAPAGRAWSVHGLLGARSWMLAPTDELDIKNASTCTERYSRFGGANGTGEDGEWRRRGCAWVACDDERRVTGNDGGMRQRRMGTRRMGQEIYKREDGRTPAMRGG